MQIINNGVYTIKQDGNIITKTSTDGTDFEAEVLNIKENMVSLKINYIKEWKNGRVLKSQRLTQKYSNLN